MATQDTVDFNLDLIGDLLTAIGQMPEPVPWLELAHRYPGENTAAYIGALFHGIRTVVSQMEFLEPPEGPPESLPPHGRDSKRVEGGPVRERAQELAAKIRESGGWKLVFDRYELDKLAVKIIVAKEVFTRAEVGELVSDFLEELSKLLMNTPGG